MEKFQKMKQNVLVSDVYVSCWFLSLVLTLHEFLVLPLCCRDEFVAEFVVCCCCCSDEDGEEEDAMDETVTEGPAHMQSESSGTNIHIHVHIHYIHVHIHYSTFGLLDLTC